MRMGRLVAAVFVAASGLSSTAYADLDCEDFDSRDEAQEHFDSSASDDDRLDADSDGRACEPYPGGGAGGGGSEVPFVLGVAAVAGFAVIIYKLIDKSG